MFRGKTSGALRIALLLSAAALVGACRPPQQMANSARVDPLESSDFFADSQGARLPVEGTVARGVGGEASSGRVVRSLHVDDEFLTTGRVGGALVDSFPFPITEQVMNRGEERFNIYCAPCHGRTGRGDGMIVRRGYRRPPSYHIDRLRQMPVGHFYDVITNGFGAMPSYRYQVPIEDRWAIVAYLRALQLSQNATVAEVPADKRAALETGGPNK
ncbi:MAG: c-type cytochrome [Thermoanaerobaculia bacterium]